MIEKLKIILCTLMIFGVLSLSAQDIRLAGLGYNNYPSVKLKDDATGYEISFQEFGVFLAFPKVLKNKKTILINGVNYGYVQSTVTNPKLGIDNSQVFHRIEYSLSVIHKLNERWLISAKLTPTLASDFENALNWDDFILQGFVVASKKASEFVRWGGGLIYTTRLGRPLLIPGFQYSYAKDRNAFQVFLPAFINYKYTVDAKEKLKAGFRIGLNGANFSASMDNHANVEVDRLNYFRINIGPELIYRINKMLQFEASGGISTKRMFTFEDTQGETYDYDSKSGPFLNFGIILVPAKPVKNKE